jgi:hypothetical protein
MWNIALHHLILVSKDNPFMTKLWGKFQARICNGYFKIFKRMHILYCRYSGEIHQFIFSKIWNIWLDNFILLSKHKPFMRKLWEKFQAGICNDCFKICKSMYDIQHSLRQLNTTVYIFQNVKYCTASFDISIKGQSIHDKTVRKISSQYL